MKATFIKYDKSKIKNKEKLLKMQQVFIDYDSRYSFLPLSDNKERKKKIKIKIQRQSENENHLQILKLEYLI